MKWRNCTIPIVAIAWLIANGTTLGDDEKSIEFQGKLAAVDLTAKTITVRNGRKEFVFQIDVHQCNVVKDGYYPFVAGAQSPTLQSARVGDAVVGELVVENKTPLVTRLYLTSTPKVALPTKDKPGYVVSPYNFNSPLSHLSVGQGAIDVRNHAHGAMLVDGATGKIFLVP